MITIDYKSIKMSHLSTITKISNHQLTNLLNGATREENISFFIGRYFHKNMKIYPSPFGNIIRIKYCEDPQIFAQMLYAKNKWHCIAYNHGNVVRYNTVADFVFVLDIIAKYCTRTPNTTLNTALTKMLNEIEGKSIKYFLIGRYFGKNIKIYSSPSGNIMRIEYCPKDNQRFGEIQYERNQWVCMQYNHGTSAIYNTVADFLLILDMIV
jgi:hypothetical protein